MRLSPEMVDYALSLAGSSRIGLGCMALSGIYGPVARSRGVETIQLAVSAGIRLFDTAPLYGKGENEQLLGEALANVPEVSIATKFGLYIGKNGETVRNSEPSVVRRSVECSLRRLKRDRIDLLLQHRQDTRIPDEEVAGVIEDLVTEGKVKAFGLSSTSVDRAARMSRHTAVRAVQNEFSLLKRAKGDLEPRAFASIGSVYIAYSPLGKGALASRAPRAIMAANDYRSRSDNFSNSGAKALSPLVAEIARCAERHNVHPASVCLAWVVASGDNVVAIPGARSPEQVGSALDGAKIALSVEEIKALEKYSRIAV